MGNGRSPPDRRRPHLHATASSARSPHHAPGGSGCRRRRALDSGPQRGAGARTDGGLGRRGHSGRERLRRVGRLERRHRGRGRATRRQRPPSGARAREGVGADGGTGEVPSRFAIQGGGAARRRHHAQPGLPDERAEVARRPRCRRRRGRDANGLASKRSISRRPVPPRPSRPRLPPDPAAAEVRPELEADQRRPHRARGGQHVPGRGARPDRAGGSRARHRGLQHDVRGPPQAPGPDRVPPRRAGLHAGSRQHQRVHAADAPVVPRVLADRAPPRLLAEPVLPGPDHHRVRAAHEQPVLPEPPRGGAGARSRRCSSETGSRR